MTSLSQFSQLDEICIDLETSFEQSLNGIGAASDGKIRILFVF